MQTFHQARFRWCFSGRRPWVPGSLRHLWACFFIAGSGFFFDLLPAPMPPPIPVILAGYSPEWPEIAAVLAARLQALGTSLVTVHHIGSTAVPGLAAKPIIDLMPLVASLAELDLQRSLIEGMGFSWHGELGIAGRRYCTLSSEDGTRVAQLHFFEHDSPHVTRHLAFRDYLRAHPQASRDYEAEKRRARNLHPADSHAYTDEKAAWVQALETQALVWLAGQKSDRPSL
jgi:GrpB-like predicted nucleotidyltransferase (UPF0157 family)